VSETRVGEPSKRQKVITTLIGLVAAPAVTGATFAICMMILATVLSSGGATGWRGSGGLGLLITSTVAGGIVGLVPALIVGLPLHHYFVRKRWNRALHYAAIGAAVGALSILVIMFVFQMWSSGMNPLPLPGLYMFVGMFAVSGTAGGLTFWIIRRPDRDTPPIPDEVFA